MDKIEDLLAYEKYWGPRFRAIASAIEKADVKRAERRARNFEILAKGGFNGCCTNG